MKGEHATSILRGVLALGRRLRAERPATAVSLAAIGLLATLRRRGPMPAARLAAEERLQPQSLTRLIADLEARGWIARTRSLADRRLISIALTGEGRAVLLEDLRVRRRWLAQAMAATLTDAERDALVEAAAAMLRLAAFEADAAAVGPGRRCR